MINWVALQALMKLRSKKSPVDPPRLETSADKVVFGPSNKTLKTKLKTVQLSVSDVSFR